MRRADSATFQARSSGTPAISDLLGGQVDASFQNINAVIAHVQSGKLHALAVTGAKRSALLPQCRRCPSRG